jgi:hypothetical protein
MALKKLDLPDPLRPTRRLRPALERRKVASRWRERERVSAIPGGHGVERRT